MRARCALVLLVAALLPGCTTPTTPSAAELTVSIDPSPLVVPEAGQRLVWNVIFHEQAGTGVRLDRSELIVVDDAGVKAAQQNGFYSSLPLSSVVRRVEGGRTTIEAGSTPFVGPPRPCTFNYTVHYTDDLGNAGSATVSVPVR